MGILNVALPLLTFSTGGAGIQITNGVVILQVSGLTGSGTAVVQSSSDLIQWISISTNLTESGTIQVIDTTLTAADQRYQLWVVSP